MFTVTFGESTMTTTQVQLWYNRFTEDRGDVNEMLVVGSNVKVLLTVFFDWNGMVHHEFLPQVQMVNKEYYLEVMSRLREAIRQKRTKLWKNQSWILTHDNAPVYTSMPVREFLAKNKTVIMPQPPYLPNLVPADFVLFPKLKTPMKEKLVATIEERDSEVFRKLESA